MAALTDDGSVIGNILTELRAAYPTIKFEASLRCFRVSCNVMDKDAVKAVRKLRKELLAKEKELKEVLTHIPTKRLESKDGRRNKR
jgi:Na+/phosphate symporter